MTNATDDATAARLQLRVPPAVKAQVEAVAAAHGVSANAAAMMLLDAAMAGTTVAAPTPTKVQPPTRPRATTVQPPVGEQTPDPAPLPPPAPTAKLRVDAATCITAAAVLAIAIPAARVTFHGTADFAFQSGAATDATTSRLFPWIIEGSMLAALVVVVARRGNTRLATLVTRVALATAMAANALHVTGPVKHTIPGRTLAALVPLAVYAAAELLASLMHNTTPTHHTGNRNGTHRNPPKTRRKQEVQERVRWKR